MLRLVSRSILRNPGNRGKRLRKLAAGVAWQLHKRLGGGPRILILPNGVRFAAHPDCVISSALIYADWPEYHELMFIRSTLRPGDILLDIGANVGHVSLLLSDRCGPEKIYAFEPNPAAFDRLVENWRLNGWPNHQLFAVAVGERSDAAYVDKVDGPLTTLSIRPTGSGQYTSVPMIRLDDYRHYWQGKSLGCVKIDVEGYEPQVFRGCDAVLRQDRPRLIMFESLTGALNSEIRDFLDARGYIIFQLNDNGHPEPYRAFKQNLFAAPDEVAETVLV